MSDNNQETGALCGTSYSGLPYEAHITIEPVFGAELELIRALAKRHGFKVADLLMQKSRTETPLRSDKDSFMTTWGDDLRDLDIRITRMIADLTVAKVQVWRYKIEQTLRDVRF